MNSRQEVPSRIAVLFFTCTAMIWAQHAYGVQGLMMESAAGKLTDLLTGSFGMLISLIALVTAVIMGVSGRLTGALTALGVMIMTTIVPGIVKSFDQHPASKPAQVIAKQEVANGDASGMSIGTMLIIVMVLVASLIAIIELRRRAFARVEEEAHAALDDLSQNAEDVYARVQRTIQSMDVPPIEVLHQRREEGRLGSAPNQKADSDTSNSKTTVEKNVRKVVL